MQCDWLSSDVVWSWNDVITLSRIVCVCVCVYTRPISAPNCEKMGTGLYLRVTEHHVSANHLSQPPPAAARCGRNRKRVPNLAASRRGSWRRMHSGVSGT